MKCKRTCSRLETVEPRVLLLCCRKCIKIDGQCAGRDNANTSMRESASATKFAIHLMCRMSVVNCEIQLNRVGEVCEQIENPNGWTENCLASKKLRKCLMARHTASNYLSKVLYLRSIGFSISEKKASGHQWASMN